ncbi:MAG: PAS domain-containing protein, partial [Planctomycetota bacterium]
MLGLLDHAEIAAVLESAIREACGVERVGVFLSDPRTGSYHLESGDASLLPERAVLEFVEEDGKPATVPHPSGGIITVFPLIVRGRCAGAAVADVTAVAEDLANADTELLVTFLDQAAATLRNAEMVSRSEEQYSLLTNILDSITNGIVTLDREQRVTRMNRNAMAMLELSPDDVGKTCGELFQAEMAEAIDEMTREFASNGFAMERMVTREFSNGLRLPMAITITPLRDQDFSNLGLIVIFRDMTASRELERLRRLDEMK